MKRVLPVIVVSQFFCTSVWFAGNAVMADLINTIGLDPGFLAHLTSSVQFGFITGTLVFAILTISDRFSPTLVFLCSSLLSSLFNLGTSLEGLNEMSLLLFRFGTGFFLAGIYPVGMKIASDHYQKGLGLSLGFLVGALVLGTAFPHWVKSMSFGLPWKAVIWTSSTLCVLGGLVMFILVPDGPFRRKASTLKWKSFLSGFKNPAFRAASFGYFGHMWELYAFWAFVPVILDRYQEFQVGSEVNTSLWSFIIIGTGSISCITGGWISQHLGEKKVATGALVLSGLCCLLSPIFLNQPYVWLLLLFLFFWGWVVIADSPLFSTLVARNAEEESRGTSLTIVNCIGFSITIVSIQAIQLASAYITWYAVYILLAIGPVLGVWALLHRENTSE